MMRIAFYTEQTRISFTVKNGTILPVSNEFAGQIPQIMMALACNTTGDGSAVEEYIPKLFVEHSLVRLDFICDGSVYSMTADDFNELAKLPMFGVSILADGVVKNEVKSEDEVMHLSFDCVGSQYYVKISEFTTKMNTKQEGQKVKTLTEQQLKEVRDVICAELDKLFWSPAVREINFITIDPDISKVGNTTIHPTDYAAFKIGEHKWEVKGVDEAKKLSTYVNTVITLAVILCCNSYNTWFKYRNGISEVIVPKANPSLKVERVKHIISKSSMNTSKKPGAFSWEKFITAAMHQVEQNMINADRKPAKVGSPSTVPAKSTEFF